MGPADDVVEPHPFPESTWVRVGSPVAAVLVALVVFAAMFAVAGHDDATAVAVLAGALALQLLLMLARGLSMRRAARLDDAALRWHQFVFQWSFWAAGTYLLEGAHDTTAVWIHIAGGLVVSLIMLAVLRLLEPRRRSSRGSDDPSAQESATGGARNHPPS